MKYKKKPVKETIPAIPLWIPVLMIALVLAAAVLALVFVLRGRTPEGIRPESSVRGYYSCDQVVRGGEGLTDTAIHDLDAEMDGKDLVFTMRFSYNYESSEGKTTLTKLVPSYIASVLPEPHRFTLSFENVSKWEITGKKSWLDYDLLQSIFVVPPTFSTQDNPTVTFLLRDNVSYKIEEDEGVLTVRLRPMGEERTTRYYACVNGINAYRTEPAVREMGFTPILAADGVHIFLISDPFDTEEEAKDFADAIQSEVTEYMAEKTVFVTALAPDELPVYTTEQELSEMEAMPVLVRGGERECAELLEVNAHVLAAAPDRDEILCFSPIRTLDPKTGDSVYSELLYLSDENGTYERLTETEFHTVLYALYSPDGTRAAFLDYQSDAEKTVLYCYDFEKEELRSIDTSSVGSMIYDFAWAADSESVCAVTLEENSGICIVRYSSDGSAEKLLDLNTSDGMLALTEDTLYYADGDKAGENVTVYGRDLASGNTSEVTSGARFILSRDGRILAAEAPDGFRVLDLKSGKELLLPYDTVYDFQFTKDGKTLLALLSEEDVHEDYPADLYSIDLASMKETFLFSTYCTDFGLSAMDGCILLNDAYTSQDDAIPVVYRAEK